MAKYQKMLFGVKYTNEILCCFASSIRNLLAYSCHLSLYQFSGHNRCILVTPITNMKSPYSIVVQVIAGMVDRGHSWCNWVSWSAPDDTSRSISYTYRSRCSAVHSDFRHRTSAALFTVSRGLFLRGRPTINVRSLSHGSVPASNL